MLLMAYRRYNLLILAFVLAVFGSFVVFDNASALKDTPIFYSHSVFSDNDNYITDSFYDNTTPEFQAYKTSWDINYFNPDPVDPHMGDFLPVDPNNPGVGTGGTAAVVDVCFYEPATGYRTCREILYSCDWCDPADTYSDSPGSWDITDTEANSTLRGYQVVAYAIFVLNGQVDVEDYVYGRTVSIDSFQINGSDSNPSTVPPSNQFNVSWDISDTSNQISTVGGWPDILLYWNGPASMVSACPYPADPSDQSSIFASSNYANSCQFSDTTSFFKTVTFTADGLGTVDFALCALGPSDIRSVLGCTSDVTMSGAYAPGYTFSKSNPWTPDNRTVNINAPATVNVITYNDVKGYWDLTGPDGTVNYSNVSSSSYIGSPGNYTLTANGIPCHYIFPSDDNQDVGPAETYDFRIEYRPIVGCGQPTLDIKFSNNDGPVTVNYGSSGILSWAVTNGSSCTRSWSPDTSATDGSESVGPITSNTTYSMTCTGATSPPATDSVTVNVLPSASINCNGANPCTINNGQSATISWSSSNAMSCAVGQNVKWEEYPTDNVLVNGNNASNESFGWGNSGVSSKQRLTSDGFVEFTTNEPSYKMAGLAPVGSDPKIYGNLVFGVYPEGPATYQTIPALDIYSGGGNIAADKTTHSIGDFFRVVANGSANLREFYKNGTNLFNYFGVSFPYVLNATFYSRPATIINAIIGDESWIALSSAGSITSALLEDTTYTIHCSGAGGNSSQSVSITVLPPPPTLSNITLTEPNYCQSGPGGNVSWNYTDPSSNPQNGYRVQIDNDPAFGSPEADSCPLGAGCTGGTSTAYAIPPGDLSFNTTYYARVMAWNSAGSPSGWATMTLCNGYPSSPGGCQPANTSWKTPIHAWPFNQPSSYDPVWAPISPAAGATVQFTDRTLFDAASAGKTWSWSFGDGGTSNQQNPAYIYSSQGSYNISLVSGDNAGSCTSSPEAIGVGQSLPTWREIGPR